jgi:hypothetical protein
MSSDFYEDNIPGHKKINRCMVVFCDFFPGKKTGFGDLNRGLIEFNGYTTGKHAMNVDSVAFARNRGLASKPAVCPEAENFPLTRALFRSIT